MQDKESIGEFVLDALNALESDVPTVKSSNMNLKHPDVEAVRSPVGNLPGHAVERLLARGGMGAVYLAKQTALEREVAVKVMTRDAASPEMAARFRREALVLGQLAHPNIVPIYDIGTDQDGQLFYTMKLVKGRTLQHILNDLRREDAAALDEHPLSSLLTVFRKISDAVAFAHSQGVIHRDLKPENIMVGEFGEVLVMDWGLARLLRSNDETRMKNGESPAPGAERSVFDIQDSSLTLQGSIMGTPQYMSPEQARGEIAELDERSDVFSLGGILYAMLTLRPPVEGKTAEEVLKKVTSGEITPPTEYTSTSFTRARQMNGEVVDASKITPLPHLPAGRVPGALSAVAMKALAFDKADRYAGVPELADDIEKFQTGFATSAENAGLATQLALVLKRHKAVAWTTVAALLLILTVSAAFMIRVQSEAQLAIDAKGEMEIERNAARAAEASAQIGLAEAALANGNLQLVSSTLEQVPQVFRNDDWHYLQDQIRIESVPITGRTDRIIAACPHPQRPSLFVVMDAKGALSLISAATGEHVFEYPQLMPRPLQENNWPKRKALAMTDDGKRLAVAHAGKIAFLNGETGELQGEWPGQPDLGFTWSQDGRLLSTQYGMLDVTSGRELWVSATAEDLRGPLKWGFEGRHAFFLPKPNELLNISNSLCSIRDPLTGEILRKLELATRGIEEGVAVSPEKNEILIGRYSTEVADHLQLATGAVREISHGLSLNAFAFTQDGQRILFVGSPRILSTGSPDEREYLLKTVHRMSGRTLETRFLDQTGSISVHPLSGEVLVYGEKSFSLPLISRKPWVTFNTAGDLLWRYDFIGSDDCLLGPITRSDELQGFKPFKQKAKYQRFLWSMDADQDSIRPHPSLPEQLHPYNYRAFHTSKDGTRFIGFSWADMLGFFERREGSEAWVFVSESKLQEAPVPRRLSFDPNLNRFWSNDGIWDAKSCALILRLKVPEGYHIEHTIWLPDGSGLVGLARRQDANKQKAFTWQAIRWDAGTGAILQSRELPCAMNALRLSPDRRKVALAGTDKAVHFIDAVSLEPLGRLRAHNEEVLHVAWHPTLSILATASADLATKFWDLTENRLLETIWAPKDSPMNIDFSPSGKLFLCHSTQGYLFVFDVRDYLGVSKADLRVAKVAPQAGSVPNSDPPPLHESLAPRKTYQTGDWIPTLDSKSPLREHDGFKEISRDADLRIQDMGEQPAWNQRADCLMGGAVPDMEFLIHTLSGMEHPHIVIRLKAELHIRALKIVNRASTDPGIVERAKDLTLWLSNDEKSWQQVWQAKGGQAEWIVDLPSGPPARYLQLGLPGKGFLHLKEIVVFGSTQ